MHLKRWITGLSALPFLIYIIIKGGLVFTLFIGLVALIGLWEYFRVTLKRDDSLSALTMKILAYLYSVLIMGSAHHLSAAYILNSVVACFWLTGLASILLFKQDQQIFEIAKKQLLGVLYVPLLLSYLILIRDGADSAGAAWILFVLAVVFFGDIGALYAGTFFGKHKLYPALSPKKTIEGSLGGLGANILVGGLYKLIFLPELSWGISLLFFIALGAAGQLGDLFESGLKRVGDIKDSGGILPGHGGILDRADAAMYAAPVAYMFKEYFFLVS
jgi:phosphatidate cytidylyltransferase